MDQITCTGCGKPLNDGDWKSKSGLCRACAEEKYASKGGAFRKIRSIPLFLLGVALVPASVLIAFADIASAVILFISAFFAVYFSLNTNPAPAPTISEQTIEATNNNQSDTNKAEPSFDRFEFRISGVTFSNPDGSSRQKLLKEYDHAVAVGDFMTISYEQDDFEGKPRISVLTDGKCIGFIEATHTKKFLSIADRIDSALLDIGKTDTDSGDSVLYCRMIVFCKKEEAKSE